MSEEWIPLPLDKGLFANLDEDAVVGFQTSIENGFVNEMGGHTRFPGMKEFCELDDSGRVVLHDFAGDLVAATDKGQLYRIDRQGNRTNVTGVPVSGGRRAVLHKTDRELLAAAGGPIIRLRDRKTELLSPDAPLSTHVAWIDGYTIAVERNSGRFYHSGPGQPDQWDPLDTFAADGSPDNINSLLITPYREILLGGADSIEQFERLLTGDVPFFRRWAIGDGVRFPYAIIFADNATWTISNLTELVRFSGQLSEAHSGEIGRFLEQLDDWTDVWIGGYPDRPLHILGQKFLIIQAPHATNPYGTKGVTILYDYRHRRFATLYGFDTANGVPNRWPGWSHWSIWGKTFVGGEGKVYELSADTYRHAGELQRWLTRTAHIAEGHQVQIKNLRLRVKRGIGTSATQPEIAVRCSRDGGPFGPWIRRGLGVAGDRLQYKEFGPFGTGSHFQFEFSCSDDCPIDLMRAEAKADGIGQ